MDLEQLPTDDEAAYARYDAVLGELAQIMRASSFLVRLTMARASGEPGVFESYKGCRRPVRATVNARMPSAVEGDLFFFDEAFSPRLRLNPLLQLLSPSPGEPGEVFLFDGAGRHGARFVAAPREFERQDESTWSWFDQQWPPQASGTSRGGERQRPPYRGLASFTAVDAQDFFGREAEAETVANRLRVAPFLAVVGPSGVGKSSFVQAGVGPLLSQDLTVIVVRPGNTPMPTLLQKIATLGVDIEGLAAAIEKDPAAFGKRLTQFALAQRTQYLLLVDQFEEVLTLCPSVIERERYAAALVSACASLDGPVRVMLTMRDDFLIRAQALEALKDSLSTGLHLLGTPQEHELVRILTQPLKRLGYAFEDPELPKQMVQEVARQPGALALLSFSATRLWEARDTHFRRLTRQAYQAMGGVGGALAGHAEETLSSMSEQARAITREAFRHLVSSSGTRAVLTRAETSELLGGAGPGAEVLEKLIDARLLVTSEGSDGDDRVEIIHEALLSSWPRLVQWQRENAELARVRDTLRATSRQWNEQGRPRGMLWRDETLAEYRFWRAKYPGSLTAVEQAFADASVREFERGRRIRRGLLVSAFVVLAVGMAVLVRANGRAEANARESAERLLKMTADQGRQAFLAGHPVEALRLLTSAADAGLDNRGMRYMIGKATAAVAAQRTAVDLGVNITALGLSPSGALVAIGSMDGTVGLYKPNGLSLQQALPPMSASVRSLQFTAQADALVGCSADGALSVWSTTTFALLDSMQLEPGILICDAKRKGVIAVGGASSILHLVSFDGRSLTKATESKYDGSAVAGIRWSPDGTRFITFMAQAVGPAAPTRRHPIESLGQTPVWLNGLSGPVLAAEWSGDGRWVVTGGEDATIAIWDGRTGEKRGEIKGHKGAVTGLALAADGKSILSTGVDGTLRQWDPEKRSAVWASPAHEGPIRHLLPTPRGLIVTGGVDQVIRIWSATGQLRASLPPQPGGLPTLALDLGGDQIISGGLEGTARAYSLSAVDFEDQVPVPNDAAGAALFDQETGVLVGNYDGPFVQYRLGVAAEPVPLAAKLVEDRAFAYASNLGLIATDRGTDLAVIDEANRVLKSLPAHPAGEGAVYFNAAGTHVLATGNQEAPLLYEWRSGQQRQLPGVKTIAASFSNGDTSDVWVGTSAGEVVFWPERGPVRRKSLGRAAVIAVSESPDRKLVAASTVDQRLHLLRADTLEEVGSGLTSISGTMVGFSADSKLVVLGESGGTVQVWNVAPFEQIGAHKVGGKLFQLTALRTRPQFLTITNEGLLFWGL